MSDREEYGSIIERFRGTEWESAPPPEPPRPPRRRGPNAGLVLTGLAGLGAIVLVVIVATRPSQPSGSTFLRPPDVTPRVPDSIRVLDRFWAIVRDPAVTYHVEGSGSSSAPDFESSFSLALDVSGDDYAGTVDTVGGSGEAELIRLGGVMYVRVTGGAWAIARTSDAGLRQDPFMGLGGRRELEYDARLVENGAAVHRLVTTKYYAPAVTRMLDLATFTLHPDVRSLELIVADDGTPLRATFSCIVNGSAVDGIPHFEGSASYEFSAFGQPVVIATPGPSVDATAPATSAP